MVEATQMMAVHVTFTNGTTECNMVTIDEMPAAVQKASANPKTLRVVVETPLLNHQPRGYLNRAAFDTLREMLRLGYSSVATSSVANVPLDSLRNSIIAFMELYGQTRDERFINAARILARRLRHIRSSFEPIVSYSYHHLTDDEMLKGLRQAYEALPRYLGSDVYYHMPPNVLEEPIDHIPSAEMPS